MSTGHLHGEKKGLAELWQMVGEGDTPKLLARQAEVSTIKDIPYGGGASVDGKRVYIDRRLHAEIMHIYPAPARWWIEIPGMTGSMIVAAVVVHEHTEVSIDIGDNPCDTYGACHALATAMEEWKVALATSPATYERRFKGALQRCQARTFDNPPLDLWCGPYLDDPSPRDREILAQFRRFGVADAFKVSKIEVNYGVGGQECRDCEHYGGGAYSTCAIVCGTVRANRQCTRYEEKKG